MKGYRKIVLVMLLFLLSLALSGKILADYIPITSEKRNGVDFDAPGMVGNGEISEESIFKKGIRLIGGGDTSQAAAVFYFSVPSSARALQITLKYKDLSQEDPTAGMLWIRGKDEENEDRLYGDTFVLPANQESEEITVSPAEKYVQNGQVEVHVVAVAGDIIDLKSIKLESLERAPSRTRVIHHWTNGYWHRLSACRTIYAFYYPGPWFFFAPCGGYYVCYACDPCWYWDCWWPWYYGRCIVRVPCYGYYRTDCYCWNYYDYYCSNYQGCGYNYPNNGNEGRWIDNPQIAGKNYRIEKTKPPVYQEESEVRKERDRNLNIEESQNTPKKKPKFYSRRERKNVAQRSVRKDRILEEGTRQEQVEDNRRVRSERPQVRTLRSSDVRISKNTTARKVEQSISRPPPARTRDVKSESVARTPQRTTRQPQTSTRVRRSSPVRQIPKRR